MSSKDITGVTPSHQAEVCVGVQTPAYVNEVLDMILLLTLVTISV